MSQKLIKIATAIVLILLPFVIRDAYRKVTALPEEITILTGPEGGLYRVLSERLAEEIEANLGIEVRRLHTNGSLDNLLLLQAGRADFGFYRPGAMEVFQSHDPDGLVEARAILLQQPPDESVSFVANLFSQPTHFFVRRDAGINSPADMEGKNVQIGFERSGSLAMSLVLLDHFNLIGKIQVMELTYAEVEQGFRDGTLDAALITMGVQSPILRNLARTEQGGLIEIPNSQALTKSHLFWSQYEIPAGLYSDVPVVVPETNINTVAAGAQLLTRSEVHTGLVEQVTRLVLNKNFVRENQLEELFAEGQEFALSKPEFPIHQGAQNVYAPTLRPFINSEFVAAWEAIRSFVASFIIAAIFGFQWLRKKRVRKKTHRLDRFLKALLEIEQQQMSRGVEPGGVDIEYLQELLDRITTLRQDALHKLSAHELNEDRATDSFIGMCHALSDKINAKISRQTFDRSFGQLLEATGQRSASKQSARTELDGVSGQGT